MTLLTTRVTELLGAEFPLVMGTMGYQSTPEFIAAAVNAGAFASLSSIMSRTPEALRQEIRRTRDLTDRPFGVNINLFPMVSPVPNEQYIEVVVDEGIQVIETAGRSPEHLMPLVRQGNLKLMHKCARVRDARKAEAIGADLVEIVGCECGGHPSRENVGSIVLVPQVADAVSIPIVAGGGIADARGFLAALALGAEGVLMGTRFLATQECPIHPNLKQRLMEACETDSVLTLYSKGDPMRALRNDMSLKVIEMETSGAAWGEVYALIGGGKGKNALSAGEAEGTLLACGQAVGLLHDIPSVGELVRHLKDEVLELHERLYTLFRDQ